MDKKQVKKFIKGIVGDKGLAKKIYKDIKKVVKFQADEKGIYVSWKNDSYIELYSNELRKVMIHINKDSHIYENKEYKERDYKSVIGKSHQELIPELWEDIYQEMRDKEEIIEARARGDGMTEVDNSFKCRRCGSKNVLVTVQQLRSADEGSTGQYTCNDCGNRWNK